MVSTTDRGIIAAGEEGEKSKVWLACTGETMILKV